METEDLFEEAMATIIEGDVDAAVAVADRCLAEGFSPEKMIDKGLTSGMIQVADLFVQEKISLPCVLMSAEAMRKALEIMEPHLPMNKTGAVITGKKGLFFSQRILARMKPLSEALRLMEPTRYTWPSFLWDVPNRIQSRFHEQR